MGIYFKNPTLTDVVNNLPSIIGIAKKEMPISNTSPSMATKYYCCMQGTVNNAYEGFEKKYGFVTADSCGFKTPQDDTYFNKGVKYFSSTEFIRQTTASGTTIYSIPSYIDPFSNNSNTAFECSPWVKYEENYIYVKYNNSFKYTPFLKWEKGCCPVPNAISGVKDFLDLNYYDMEWTATNRHFGNNAITFLLIYPRNTEKTEIYKFVTTGTATGTSDEHYLRYSDYFRPYQATVVPIHDDAKEKGSINLKIKKAESSPVMTLTRKYSHSVSSYPSLLYFGMCGGGGGCNLDATASNCKAGDGAGGAVGIINLDLLKARSEALIIKLGQGGTSSAGRDRTGAGDATTIYAIKYEDASDLVERTSTTSTITVDATTWKRLVCCVGGNAPGSNHAGSVDGGKFYIPTNATRNYLYVNGKAGDTRKDSPSNYATTSVAFTWDHSYNNLGAPIDCGGLCSNTEGGTKIYDEIPGVSMFSGTNNTKDLADGGTQKIPGIGGFGNTAGTNTAHNGGHGLFRIYHTSCLQEKVMPTAIIGSLIGYTNVEDFYNYN